LRASAVLAVLFASGCRSGYEASQTDAAWRAPIVDDTRALGRLLPSGDQQAETVWTVDTGRVSGEDRPSCIGSPDLKGSAGCATLCVRYPPGSKISEVKGLAAERDAKNEWLPCDAVTCLGTSVTDAKAMFEPSGPNDEPSLNRVCWGFRNWHTERTRQAILVVTLRAPK
jgi:hypothetical protein